MFDTNTMYSIQIENCALNFDSVIDDKMNVLHFSLQWNHSLKVLFSRIVPNIDEDESPVSKSDESSCCGELNDIKSLQSIQSPKKFTQNANIKALDSLKCLQSNPEDDEIGDGLRTTSTVQSLSDTIDFSQQNSADRTQQTPFTAAKVERRRRKLPEIPKNRKCKPTAIILAKFFSCEAFHQFSIISHVDDAYNIFFFISFFSLIFYDCSFHYIEQRSNIIGR